MTALDDEWHASLALSFVQRKTKKTVLANRQHKGPLLVQKALYPEGPQVCHVAILHPPSGIAGGDVLKINIEVASNAHALLATPGATRWYKANNRQSAQSIEIKLAAGALLDWLPQENIFFEQANARTSTQVHLETGACAIGWEINQLGSITKASHWDEGALMLDTRLMLDQHPIWIDTGELDASSLWRTSASGLAGFPVFATLWAFGPSLTSQVSDELATSLPFDQDLRAGITCMPQPHNQALFLVRVLGLHAEDVKQLLIKIWMVLRPLLLKKEAQLLRIWST